MGKGKKYGILPFVQDFEDFVELAESIFRDSERRSDIDKAYKELTKAVLAASKLLLSFKYEIHLLFQRCN